MNFKNYYNLQEDKKSYRQRLQAIKQNQLIDKGIDIVNKEEARIKMKKAYNDAHLKNKESLEKTKHYPTIYHMISLRRINKTDLKNSLGITLNYLLFPEDDGYENDEISVSVDKGIWDYKDAIVLEGTGKLEYYFDVDIYSKPVEIKKGVNVKIPQALHRKSDIKHWDEAFVKLKNIKWSKLIIGDMEMTRDLTSIQELLKETDLIDEYENKINDTVDVRYWHQEHTGGIADLANYEQEKEEKIQEIDHIFSNINDSFNEINRKYQNLSHKSPELTELYNSLIKKIPTDIAMIIPDQVEQSQDDYLKDLDDTIDELNELNNEIRSLNKMINNQKMVAEKYNPAWQLNEVEINDKHEELGKYDEEDQKINNTVRNLRRNNKGGWKPVSKSVINNIKYEIFQKGKQFDVFASDYNNDNTYGIIQSTIRPFDEKVKNFPQVYLTYVYDKYQGKKIGQTMHEQLLLKCGGIISDMTLTTGSYKVFKRLGEKYPLFILDENDNLIPFNNDEFAKGNYNRVLVLTK